MDKSKKLRELLERRVVLLDGATGTELMKRGMPSGVPTEVWALENMDALRSMHRDYVTAGADIILTCTFGGNGAKLGDTGLVTTLNRKLAEVALQEAGGSTMVAGSMGPTGLLMQPSGDLSWTEAYQHFHLQAKALAETGIDIFFLETFSDTRELKAAVLAVRDVCPDSFISGQMTFGSGGITLTGTSPTAFAALMDQIPVDAAGVNCGQGPGELLPVLQEMARYSHRWISAEPNAGLPVKGEWDMSPERFAGWLEDFAWAGCAILGGCCGTGPDHVREYVSLIGKRPVEKPETQEIRLLSSLDRTVQLGRGLVTVGESINPTGKKSLQESISRGDCFALVSLARAQGRADVIDVNLGLEKILPKGFVQQLFSHLAIGRPLSVDLSGPENIRTAFRNTGGIALLNSVTADETFIGERIGTLLRHGGYVVLLPMDSGGVGDSPEERMTKIRRGLSILQEHGFPSQRVIVDPIVKPLGTGASASVTLETLDLFRRNGFLTVAGISNVSHGMPERGSINSAFLAAMATRGLDLAIVDVLDGRILETHRALRMLEGSMEYIEMKLPELDPRSTSPDFMAILRKSIIVGDRRQTEASARELLESGVSASEILSQGLFPAMDEVGSLYSRRKIFLPHLISSAEASRILTRLLRPLLEKDECAAAKGRIVLASVKGDVHDIGKNLVGLFLGSSGYEVIDLGRDVGAEEIVRTAEEEGADIVALSALMSTTAPEMERVISLVRERLPGVGVLVGGAVLNREYAMEIGADGYASDAFGAAAEADRLMGNERG